MSTLTYPVEPTEGWESLNNRLGLEINAWEGDIGGLVERWNRNCAMYRVDESVVTMRTVDGSQPYAMPLWRIKCDTLTGNVQDALFATDPPVQAFPIDTLPEEAESGSEDAEAVERILGELARMANVEDEYALAVWDAANTNFGILRVTPTYINVADKGDGTPGEIVGGMESEAIDPRHFFFYPTTARTLAKAKSVGHRYHEAQWEVDAKILSGEYWPADVFGGDSARTYDEPKALIGEASQARPSDGQVEMFELVTNVSTGPGQWERMKVTYAKTLRRILKVEAYPYDTPWYRVVRLIKNERKVLGEDSVAQSVQGVGAGYSDMVTVLVEGSYGAAIPMIAVIGSMGSNKFKRYEPGLILNLPEGVTLQEFRANFDPGALPAIMEKFEQIADSVTGISRIGSSQALPADTKATAINALTNADARRQNSFVNVASEGLEGVWELMLEFLRKDRDHYARALGQDNVPAQDVLDRRYRITASSRSAASTQSRLQQGFALKELTADPRSELSYAKVEDMIVGQLDLGSDPKALKSDAASRAREALVVAANQGLDPEQVVQAGMTLINAQTQLASTFGMGPDGEKPPVPAPPSGPQ